MSTLQYGCLTRTPTQLGVPAGYTIWVDPTHNHVDASGMGIADIDGSGVGQLIYAITARNGNLFWRGTPTAISLVPFAQEGLLSQITTAEGASTSITYATAFAQGLSIPTATWLVTDIKTVNGLGGQQIREFESTYAYANPIYDLHDQQFVGFGSVTESILGDPQTGAVSPGLVRKTTFATQTGPLLTIDYGFYRASRGLPSVVEESSMGGTRLRTTVNLYADGAAIKGIDGRAFNHIWLNKQSAYMWDPQQQVGNARNVAAIVQHGPFGDFYFSQSVYLPGTAPIEHEVRDDLTIAGNTIEEIDYGSSGLGDSAIHTKKQWQLQGSSGWSYRATQTRTYSLPASGATREYDYFYDGNARLTDVKSPLSGTLELPGPSGQARAAGRPSEQSRDGTVLLKHIDYDGYGFGLVRRVQGPNGQCTSINYDTAFSQFPISEIVYTGGSCGQGGLATTFVFDRGIEQITMKIAPDGGTTTMKYDVFGRPTEIDQPNFQPGMSATPAAILFDYLDQVPIRRVHARTIDGPAASAVYRDHYRYIDSFGDTLASLDEAGPDRTDGGPVWTVSGVHTTYFGGSRLRTLYKPLTMFGHDPSDPSQLASYAYTGPVESFGYDELGQVIQSYDFNGNKSTRIYQPTILSVSRFDADQQPGGKHVGSFTKVTMDGHGRVAQTVKHLANGPQGAGNLTTTTQYQATGEPIVVTQSYPGGSVTRWMQYDSLGRLVFNAEPNTSQHFSATPGTAGVVGWTYAYSDSGLLVGTSDARGCGENIFHDGARRTIAEDYSPCDPSQPAYSVPDLQNGNGAEAFYLYDGVSGRLTDQYDRAQHSTYQYDARDEVTQVQRRMGTPSPDPVLNQRYATHIFTKSVSLYSESHRPLKETTGADVPEVMGTGTGGSGTLQISYTRDGRVQSVAGDYGSILVNADYDATGAVLGQVLGDAAFTTIDHAYNNDETLQSYSVHRKNGPWLAPSSTYAPPPSGDPTLIGILTSSNIQYEKSGSIISITDTANASQWPSGLKPSTRTFSYYDDYRLKDAATSYAGGNDPFNYTPFGPDSFDLDQPFPPVSKEPNRVRDQSYSYDWLGNTASASSTNADDNLDFPDRSLGKSIAYGASTAGPHQLQTANNTNGSLQTFYDAAGNVTEIDVSGSTAGWTYKYTWDELGRMSSASRIDTGGPPSQITYQQFQYDAQGQRIINYYYVNQAQVADLQVFPSLVVRVAQFDNFPPGSYQIDSATEQVYVDAGGTLAHVFHVPQHSGVPNLGPTGSTYVALILGDPTGSTGFVIDRDTSELMERPTYMTYGADESDYRPDRWANLREKIRYTGHEDDAEVGLVYFGARYYSTLLQRWVSPDPLTIHGLGADPNPYAYVGGSPIGHIDRFGFAVQEAYSPQPDNGPSTPVEPSPQPTPSAPPSPPTPTPNGPDPGSPNSSGGPQGPGHDPGGSDPGGMPPSTTAPNGGAGSGSVDNPGNSMGPIPNPSAGNGPGGGYSVPNPWWDNAVTRHPVLSAAALTVVGSVMVLEAWAMAAEWAEAGTIFGEGSVGAARAALTRGESAGLRQLFGRGTAGARSVLSKLAGGGKPNLPPGVTNDTLRTYLNIAKAAVQAGIDKQGTQALRIQIIEILLQ